LQHELEKRMQGQSMEDEDYFVSLQLQQVAAN
jgi:hypothetical protein